jgi:hypothetical protein
MEMVVAVPKPETQDTLGLVGREQNSLGASHVEMQTPLACW